VLEAAPKRVVEAILEIAVDGEGNEVVVALDGLVIGAAGLGAALVLILIAGKREQMGGDGEVALIADLVAVRDIVDRVSGAVEHGLSCDGVAVGAGDGDGVAQRLRPEAIVGGVVGGGNRSA
jgi:hypothetical protein